MASTKRSISEAADWNEASCPICMEHPHNAVLLLCSSHEKGCRSYICDTSYRHSNCLDRFKNLKDGGGNLCPSSSPTQGESGNLADNNHMGMSEGISETSGVVSLFETGQEEANSNSSDSKLKLKLKCPMCRGDLLGWKVVEEARTYLNAKPRTCSSESCPFMGNYGELRQHARSVHPTARPTDIDPSRQQAWRQFQVRREFSDIISAINSTTPGATVLGDYAIENGDGLPGEREIGPGEGEGEGGQWMSAYVLFQMIELIDTANEINVSGSRTLLRQRLRSRRRVLWGDNSLDLQDEEEETTEDETEFDSLTDMNGDVPLNSRRRRRLTQSRSDEDQR